MPFMPVAYGVLTVAVRCLGGCLLATYLLVQMYSLPTEGFEPSPLAGATHSVFSRPLEKPDRDENEYKLLRLHNGMQVLLISDQKADMAAAAMAVGVGHLDDPDDLPGCAHFCEHLLFMGTEKYPGENEYKEFVQAGGGYSNAFTGASDTNYHFSVSPPHLFGALERFSWFFHKPLFSPAATMKEMQAVDSENKQNLSSDSWRLYQLFKTLATPGHAWRKFGTGSLETLKADVNGGLDTRDKLMEWWKAKYSAEWMSLTVLGPQSLEELEEKVILYFDAVPNRGSASLPWIDQPAFGPEELGVIVFTKTVMDLRGMEITWPIPWQEPRYDVKPAGFIAHLLGHEAPGSLCSYLKQQGWALGLDAGEYGGGRGFSFFRARISLTEAGYRNYETVLLLLFGYLCFLRSSPLPPWLQLELITLSKLGFQNMEKRDPVPLVTELSQQLLYPYPRELVLSADIVVRDWNEEEVRDLLNALTPTFAIVTVASQEVEHSRLGKTEPWYGTEYGVQKMKNEFMAKITAEQHVETLHLPLPNRFIPENVHIELVKAVAHPATRPTMVFQSDASIVWHKHDDQFRVPTAVVCMEIRSPICDCTCRQAAKSTLFGSLVSDALRESTYDASVAGLYPWVTGYENSLDVSINGYSEKLPLLLETVLERIVKIVISEERFEALRVNLKESYGNARLDQPYDQSDWWASHILSEKSYKPSDLAEELDTMTLDEVQSHGKEVIARSHMKMLVVGNLGREAALRLAGKIEAILKARPLTPWERLLERSYLLPHPCNLVLQRDVTNREERNSALAFYVQIGSYYDLRLRALLDLFVHMVEEPCFNELRTKEQLGYTVLTSRYLIRTVLGLRLVVQSERDPMYLEKRVEVFMEFMKRHLDEMPEPVFEKQRQGYIDWLLEKKKNLKDEANWFWTQVTSDIQNFDRVTIDAEVTRNLTLADVKAFFMENIHPSSTTRAKLSTHIRSHFAAPPTHTFTQQAAAAFLAELRSYNLDVDEAEYYELCQAEPPLEVAKEAVLTLLGASRLADPAVRDSILSTLERVAKETQPPGLELPPGATLIHDIDTLHAQLMLSDAPRPVAV